MTHDEFRALAENAKNDFGQYQRNPLFLFRITRHGRGDGNEAVTQWWGIVAPDQAEAVNFVLDKCNWGFSEPMATRSTWTVEREGLVNGIVGAIGMRKN